MSDTALYRDAMTAPTSSLQGDNEAEIAFEDGNLGLKVAVCGDGKVSCVLADFDVERLV